MTRGLAELTRLGVAMGAEPQTLAGLAGMGDLMATCMSPYSRNRTVGELLGRGKALEEILADMHMVAEGVGTARRPCRWPSATGWSCRSARRSTRWSWACSDRSTPTEGCGPPATSPTRGSQSPDPRIGVRPGADRSDRSPD